jgi:carbon-monoxide dehydrogenase large subunit
MPVESTGLGPYEGATVRIATNGKIVLYTYRRDPQGQSHKTTLAQIAADPLGVSYEDVTVATADTKEIAFGVGTFAARTRSMPAHRRISRQSRSQKRSRRSRPT